MNAVNKTNLVWMSLHDYRSGPSSVAKEPNTFHQSAVSYTCGRKYYLVTRGKIAGSINPLEVSYTHCTATFFMFWLFNNKASKNITI